MIQRRKAFDAYEVHGCRRNVGGSEQPPHFFEFLEQCDDDEAEVWSLYGHITGEGLHCIGDFLSRDHAEGILQLLDTARLVKLEIERLLDDDNVMICSQAGDSLSQLSENLETALAEISRCERDQ